MAIFPFSVDSVRIGTANITASGGNIVLPAGTQVGNQTVATVVEVSTGGGPKVTNLQITDNAWTVLDDTAVDTAGGYVLITGTNFVSGALVYFNQTPATSVAFVGTTTLRVTVPALTAGTYIVYVINPDGGTAIRVPGLTASANPAWQTGSALPEQYDGVAITLNLVATDATSYTVTSGSLPPGLSLNANTGVITGTVTGVAVDTVYTFTVRATDAQNQDSPRTFTVTIVVSDPYFKLTTLLLSGSAISANTVIRDSSTNNFNLTVFGDARASNFTPYGTGWSNYFDGSGDWLVTSNVGTTTGDFTLELWCYLDSSQPQGWYPYVFGTNSPWQGSGGIGLVYNTQSGVADGTPLSFNVAGGGITVDTHSNLKSRWVHLALTRSGSTIRAFLNGTVLASTLTNSSTINTSTFMIGGVDEGGSYGNHAMKCWISNFRFVKDSALYTANFTPATSSLTSITNTALLICQSNRFVDNSANNYSLSRSGDVKIDSFNPFNITNTGVNGSMYFDGTGDYCTTSGNAAFALGTGDFCLETWIYPNSISTGTFDRIVATSDYNGAGFDWTLNTASSALYVAGTAYSISNLVVRSWNHLVYTRSGGVLRGFLNGNLAVYNASATGNVTSTGELRIGTGYSGTAYNGYISNLRIVKGSIPAAYQTSSTTVNTSIFSPPTTLLTAVTGTSLLTLQYDQPHNNHTFLDSSSNQFLITRNGNTSQGTFSPFSLGGWSYYFNGTASASQAILTPTNAQYAIGTGQFSIESWVYLQSKSTSSGNSTHFIISQGNNANNLMWGLYITDSTNYISWGLTGSAISLSTYPVTKNTWNHIVVTRNASNEERIFLNGTLINLRTNTTNYSNASSTQIQIGTSYDTNYPGAYGVSSYGNTFSGYISQLRLDIGGIPSAYQTSSTTVGQTVFTPPATPLIVTPNTKLLIGQDNRFKDNSTITAVLTPNGNTSVAAFSPFAATAVYNPAVHGGSAYFDGTGDYLSSSINAISTNDFTIQYWSYLTSHSGTNGEGGYFQISATSGGLEQGYTNGIMATRAPGGTLVVNVTNTSISTSYALPLNQWFYTVITRLSNTVRVYVNNLSVATPTTVSTNLSGTFCAIGGYYNTNYLMTGYLANFRVLVGTGYNDGTLPTLPIAPLGSNTETRLLLNFTDSAILDNTGRNAVETAGDAKTSSVITKFTGGSIYFDGTGDWAITTTSPINDLSTGNWTIEFWIYPTTAASAQTIINLCTSASNYNGTHIWMNTSRQLVVDNTQVNQSAFSGGTLTLNTWNHVAITRISTTTTGYINGSSVGTNNYTPNSNQAVCLGYMITVGYPFNGYLSDIRITKGYARYTANFTAPTVPARLK